MNKRDYVTIRVGKKFFETFEDMRKSKEKELGITKLGQINFSNMLVNSKSMRYPKLNVKSKKY